MKNLMLSEVSAAPPFNTGGQSEKVVPLLFGREASEGLMCPVFQGMNYRAGSARVPTLRGCRAPPLVLVAY